MITVINTIPETDPNTQADSQPVVVLMTVDLLVSIRERITNQIPGFRHQLSIVDDIDAVLSQLPLGLRPDVDRLLGRYPVTITQEQADLLSQWRAR